MNPEQPDHNPAELTGSENQEFIETQANNRMIALKAIRQTCADVGFREQGKPVYADPENKQSEIVFKTDTITEGVAEFRLTLDGQITCTVNWDAEFPPRSATRECVMIKKDLKKVSTDAIHFVNLEGKAIDVPDEIVKTETPSAEDEGPRGVPLDRQDVHYDARRGMWYGTPKSN